MMDPQIHERFNDAILAEARSRYGIRPDSIHLLDSFENFMFEYHKDGRSYILRLSHSRRRTPDLIRGEVDWINYLAAGGAGVAKAVLSDNGNLVEAIDDGRDGQFLATAFDKAPGGPPWKKGQWHEALFRRYGRLLGRIHRLSQSYQPANPAWRRLEWDAPVNMAFNKTAPAEDALVLQKYRDVVAYLQSLPKPPQSYGLIHQDAHAGNFFVTDDGRLTLFDFDDCVYSWYVYDIAMVAFYAVTNRDSPEGLIGSLWPPFWQAYRSEFDLDPVWLREIPHFMKLRELELYIVLRSDVDLENDVHPWTQRYMDDRRRRLENDVPYLNYDFPTE